MTWNEPAISPPMPVYLGFVPVSGTYGSLESLDDKECYTTDSYPGPLTFWDIGFGHKINPVHYKFTAPSGDIFYLDRGKGLQRIETRNGNTITYQDNGIIHSAGRSVSFERDSKGRITRATDPMGESIQYVYDSRGDLVQVIDRMGYVTRFSYNAYHGLIDIYDPLGRRPLRNIYDEDGRLIAQIDADGERREMDHDLNERKEILRDPYGNETVVEYDEGGNVTSVTNALGQVINYDYDGDGNMTGWTDPLGNTTNFTYDAKGNRTSITDPMGNTNTYGYDTHNNINRYEDSEGNVTDIIYDAQGNLTSFTDPLGSQTSYAYDSSGNLTGQTDPLGNTRTFTYNAYGDLTSQTSPRGQYN